MHMTSAAASSRPANRTPASGRESGGALVAIVLAGAHAWRGTPFDALLPRPVLPVALKPLIAYPLEWLHAWGIDHVTVCADGLATVVRSQLEPYADSLPALEFRSDPQPRGAAGCARDAALAGSGEVFVVVDGTTVPDVDLSRVLDEHRQTKAAITVVVQPTGAPDPLDAPLVPTGIYVFSRRALEAVPPRGYQDIKESLIPQLRQRGERVMTCEADGVCPRVLDADSYLALDAWMVQRLAMTTAPLHRPAPGLEGGPVIHATAQVDPSALIVGPVIIDAGARIMADATLVGPLTIGRDSVVGERTLVSRSIVWAGCTIAEDAMVDRSVLADDIAVPAGSRLVGVIRASDAASNARARKSVRGLAAQPAVADHALAFQ